MRDRDRETDRGRERKITGSLHCCYYFKYFTPEFMLFGETAFYGCFPTEINYRSYLFSTCELR
jgi:hypothetical protein